MNHPSKILFTLIAMAALSACQPQDASDATSVSAESTLEAQVSYGLAYSYVSQLADVGVALDVAAFAAGARDAVSGAESQLSDDEIQLAFDTYQAQLQEAAIAEQEAAASENQAQADAFLAENAQADGVMTTASGLQYKVLEAGEGEMPSSDSLVQVHYEGRLLDGTVFDSSYERGVPVEFGVTQVIPGWTEALQLMPEGSKWQLFIPPQLGYGPSGAGGLIGPNSLLIFDVELIQANYQEPAAEAPAQ